MSNKTKFTEITQTMRDQIIADNRVRLADPQVRARTIKANRAKRKLSVDTMRDIKACAWMYLFGDGTNWMRILVYAYDKSISIYSSAIRYTIGACKRVIWQGLASTYDQALEVIGARQVGDHTTDRARTLAIDSGRASGRVLGTLYTEYETDAVKYLPDRMIADKDRQDEYLRVKANITRFFGEYTDRLGPTSKARLYELAKSTVDADELVSANGMRDQDTKRLAWGAYTLYRNSPVKDAMSCQDFIGLVRRWVKVPAMEPAKA